MLSYIELPTHHLEAIVDIDASNVIFPFRWDITQRQHLGSLIPNDDRDTRLEHLERYLDSTGRLLTAAPHAPNLLYWFEQELRRAIARIIAFGGNADLVFVVRSPESLFDFASGLLADTSYASRLHLLHFSMSDPDARHHVAQNPQGIQAFRAYLHSLQLSPQALVQRTTPVAFVDIVAQGRTFENLVRFIHIWSQESHTNWRAVQAKIRLVGLTKQRKTSPNTWRWQQHAAWISLLPQDGIRNVSIPDFLFEYFGDSQPKTTASYPPRRWGDMSITEPQYNKERLDAIRLAIALYDAGKQQEQRQLLRKQLQSLPTIRQRWLRNLVLQLT